MLRSIVLSCTVAAVSCLSGCGSSAHAPKAKMAKDDHGHDHDHAHGAAPHGGTVFDFGGGAYHAEFTVDHDKKEAVVYILGGDAKTPQAVEAESLVLVLDEPKTELTLAALPQDGEAKGKSSRFAGKHDTLGIVREFSGTVTGKIGDTPYRGEFKEQAHGHDHAK